MSHFIITKSTKYILVTSIASPVINKTVHNQISRTRLCDVNNSFTNTIMKCH